MASDTTSNDSNPSPNPASTAPTPSDPMQELYTSRTHLANAFKYLLITVHLPAIAGISCIGNLFSYWKAHVRLCDVTRFCGDLLSLPLFLAPLTLVFIFIALFTLDHYLSISPTFCQSGLCAPQQSNTDTDDATQPPVNEGATNPVFDNGGRRKPLVLWVLQAFTITSYALSTFWAVSSVAAVTGAALVLKYDAPFDPNTPSGAGKERVVWGFIVGVFAALLAFFTLVPAISLLRAARCVVSMVAAGDGHLDGAPVRESRAPAHGDAVAHVYALWDQRSTLDKAVLLPLISLFLSFLLFLSAAWFTPFSHLRHLNDAVFAWTCFLNALFTWSVILVFHRYRCSGLYPGATIRAFISVLCLVVATVWLFVSDTYLFLSLGALFCDDRAPLPYNSPCAYIRKSGSWVSIVTCAFGFLQAFILGATATMSWESRGGIRLDTEDGGTGSL